MAQVTELNIERKKRVRNKRLWRLVVLVLLGGAMTAAMYLFPLLEGISFSALMQEAFGTVGRSGSFPVSLIGETASGIYNLGGSAAVLTDTNVQVFSPAGRPYGTVQNGFAEPVLKTSASRAVLYGKGAKGLMLLTKGGKLAQTELDENVITAEVSGNGRVAAATPAARHAASVRVFDPDFNTLFTWYSAENHVLTLGLSADGAKLAVGTVTAQDGALLSFVKQFSVTQQKELCETRLSESLVLSLKYVQHGVQVVADNQTLLINETGEVKQSYPYAGKPLAGYSVTGSSAALVLGEYKSEHQLTVVSLDEQCGVRFALVVHEQVRDVYTDGLLTYVLTDTALTVYNQSGQVQLTEQNDFGWIGVAANGEDVYLLQQHGVQKLEQPKDNT